MRTQTGLVPRQPRDRPAVLTIGSLDGVHRGHRALVEETVRLARQSGADAVAVTFEPHPRCVLEPESCPPRLTSLAEKEVLLAALGVDRLVVLPFTRDLAQLSATDFCDALRAAFDVVGLVAGYDFALGHRRAGDIAFLRDYGARHGIAVTQVPALELSPGVPASSSAIRAMLASGDVEAAALALGRPHAVTGAVVAGERRGRTLGYPTLNIAVAAGTCLPGHGVYATWVWLGGAPWMGATSVGVRPTFAGTDVTVEAHLLDFDADAYGAEVRCEFASRLREERAYGEVADLVDQMGRDVEETRRRLSAGQPANPR
ncbi:MAG: bifunctional riboflavin kinase/FAD synthetase [Candidatus Dormibacteria bacterium]